MIYYDSAATAADSNATTAYAQQAALEADSAYAFEMGVLGYTPPQFTENSHYSIYLAPLSSIHAYGETLILDGGQILPNAPSGANLWRSYCIVDNSFNDSIYATHGFEALRITIFHEFFHMTQFSGYGYPPVDGVFFQEMSSVWMEWLSSPTIKDYLSYVGSYLHALDQTLASTASPPPLRVYGAYLFFAYLSNKFDTSIIKQIWTNYRDLAYDPVTAIDLALESHGTNFCEEYERFGSEIMQVGRRYAGSVLLPDAQILPADTVEVNMLIPGTTLPFVTVALSLQFAGIGAGRDTCIEVIARDTDRSLQSNASIEFTSFGSPPILTLDSAQAYCDTEVCLFALSDSSPGLQVYPDPFVSDGASSVYLLASNAIAPPISVIMNIMDLNMNEIRAAKYTSSTILPFKGSWNAAWDGRDDNGKLVASGEYIYSLLVDGALKVGKIVVVRK